MAETSREKLVVCQKHNSPFLSEFCETCQRNLCSLCLKDHATHLISAVNKLAGGFKKKLHKMLDDNDNDEKHLAKYVDTAKECLDNFKITTNSELRQKIFVCMGQALENCKEQLDMKEDVVLRAKNVVQSNVKHLQDELDGVKLKQDTTRSLLSETNDTLVEKIEGVKSTTSLYRTSTQFSVPFDSEFSSFEEKKFTSELEELLSRYVGNVSIKTNEVKLNRSCQLSYALTCFRKRQPNKLKMASCDDFMCLGYVDAAAKKINLEFVKNKSLQAKEIQIDFILEEEIFMISGFVGVIVKVGAEIYLLYKKFDEEPVEVKSKVPILGCAKKDNEIITLHTTLQKIDNWRTVCCLKWSHKEVVFSITDKKNGQKVYLENNSKSVIFGNPKEDCQFIIVSWVENSSLLRTIQIYSEGTASVNDLKLSSSSYKSLTVAYQSNGITLFGWKKKGEFLDLKADVYKLCLEETVDLKFIEEHQITDFELDCGLVDVHYFGKSLFIKLETGQILKLDGLTF